MENKIKPEIIQDLVISLILDLLGNIYVSWISFQFTSIENRKFCILCVYSILQSSS